MEKRRNKIISTAVPVYDQLLVNMVPANFSRTPHVLKIHNATPLYVHVILMVLIGRRTCQVCRNVFLLNHPTSRQVYFLSVCIL